MERRDLCGELGVVRYVDPSQPCDPVHRARGLFPHGRHALAQLAPVVVYLHEPRFVALQHRLGEVLWGQRGRLRVDWIGLGRSEPPELPPGVPTSPSRRSGRRAPSPTTRIPTRLGVRILWIGVPRHVVVSPLIRIGQHLVRLLDLHESVLRPLHVLRAFTLLLVGVVPQRQLPVRPLDLAVVRSWRHVEYFVRVHIARANRGRPQQEDERKEAEEPHRAVQSAESTESSPKVQKTARDSKIENVRNQTPGRQTQMAAPRQYLQTENPVFEFVIAIKRLHFFDT